MVDRIRSLLDELASLGATVTKGSPAGDAQVAALEKTAACAFPPDYARFPIASLRVAVQASGLVRVWCEEPATARQGEERFEAELPCAGLSEERITAFMDELPL